MRVRTRAPGVRLPSPSLARARAATRAIDRPGIQALGAFLLYVLVSVLFFGIPVLADVRHSYVGLGRPGLGTGFTDPSVYMWSLVWWPHALTHGLDPLHTNLVWAPEGVSLAWTTTLPGASILAWPVTAWLGPVGAYNVLMLLAPALAAWTAFILCRHVTGAFWASIAGGYLFGFGSYELAQMTAHLNLALIFPVPLAVLLVLLRIEERLRPLPFVLLLGATVALQYSFSMEIAFTMTLFGGIVGGLAFVLFPQARQRLLRTAGWAALAYAGAALALAPFLLSLSSGAGFVPRTWHAQYASDLANLVTPTRIALLRPPGAEGIAERFPAGLSEEGAYLGPLLLLVALFAVGFVRTGMGRLLLWSFGLIVLASLGPALTVAGSERIPLPWALTEGLPLVRMALPARFILYAWLIIGVMAALWLSDRPRLASIRWGRWPAFFATDLHRRHLAPGRNTLVIPFASNGFSMLWQAESRMAFPMSGGYIACRIPVSYQRWSIVATFLSKRALPGHEDQLRAFLGHLDVANIVLDPRAEGPWDEVFGAIPVRPVRVGGILYYRVPDELLGRYRFLEPPNPTKKALRRSCQ
jgi:hypothetical protein